MIYNKLSCYIIDDEFHCIENLTGHIEQFPGMTLLGSSTDPLEGLQALGRQPSLDVLFLDINMPQLSGLQLAGLVDEGIEIIFTTGYVQYAVDAFEKEAFDFLLKPISFERFERTILRLQRGRGGKALSGRDAMEKSIYINTGGKGKFVHIRFSEIIFIESVGHYILIQTQTESYRTHLAMKDILSDLPADRFVRMHRSFIVSLDMIRAFSGSQITLLGDFKVPIGDFYKEFLMAKLSAKISRKN